MDREEFYLNELMLSVAVIIVILSAFWYYNALTDSKNLASEKIAGLQNSCVSYSLRKSECDIVQDTYDLEKEVLCSAELKTAQQRLNERIQNNYNLIEVKELMRPTGVENIEELRGVLTMGEFTVGDRYFKETSEDKYKILQSLGAVEGCFYRNEKMRSYASCDMKNAQSLINPENAVAVSYFKEARRAFDNQEFLRAIYFTTAAVSYSGENARDAYADIVEGSRTQGLVC